MSNEPGMIVIPEGDFVYGSRADDKDALPREIPQQRICLPAFDMAAYPVTNRQYCRFLNDSKPREKDLELWIGLSEKSDFVKSRILYNEISYVVEEGYDDHPVIYVSWFGAEAYAKWDGKRLPFEVEWEKAARGRDGLIYPWGKDFDENKCHVFGPAMRGTAPVGNFPQGKSPYGCFDMVGNVWEWCADWFDENNDKASPGRCLSGPEKGSEKIFRGGGWRAGRVASRAAFREKNRPSFQWSSVGFRLAGCGAAHHVGRD